MSFMVFCSQISIANIDVYPSSSWFIILDEMFLLPDSMKISWICFMTVVLYKAKWRMQILQRILIGSITDILKIRVFLHMIVSLEPWIKLFCRPFVRYCFICISVFKYQYFSTILCHISRYDCRYWTMICYILLHSNSFSFCGLNSISLKHIVVCGSIFIPHRTLRVN